MREGEVVQAHLALRVSYDAGNTMFHDQKLHQLVVLY